MKLLLVQDGQTIEEAYEMRSMSLLSKIEIDENMPDSQIQNLLNIIEDTSKSTGVTGRMYGILNEEIMPLEEIPFMKAYYNRIKSDKKPRWKFW